MFPTLQRATAPWLPRKFPGAQPEAQGPPTCWTEHFWGTCSSLVFRKRLFTEVRGGILLCSAKHKEEKSTANIKGIKTL